MWCDENDDFIEESFLCKLLQNELSKIYYSKTPAGNSQNRNIQIDLP